MSDAQRIMLFSLFAKLAKARAWGPAQRELERERITRAALLPADHRSRITDHPTPSWSLCDNTDVDRLKRRLLAELEPDSLAAQIADAAAGEDGERRRLIHRIERDALRGSLRDAYLMSLCRDLYDRTDWRALPLPELANLRDTVAARSRRKAKANRGDAETRSTADQPF